MADRYWIGTSGGAWNAASTTNWSATSGGVGGASAPTVFGVTVNANITTRISNVASAGYTPSCVLQLTGNGSAFTVVWPASFRWPNGTAPTLTSTLNKVDTIVAYTRDGGTNWFAYISGQNS